MITNTAGRQAVGSFGPKKQAPKSGSEPFHTASVPSGFALLDYWQWAESDLLNNTRRAILAEFLVARAVGATEEPRVEWAGVDVVTPDGIQIEVKSSAYVQSWPQQGPSAIFFDIAPRESSWDPSTNETVTHDPPRRVADVYVFCILGDKSGTVPDPLDLADWKFYVVATSVLDEEKPSQGKISMQPLAALIRSATGMGAIGYGGLQEAIQRAVTLERTFQQVEPGVGTSPKRRMRHTRLRIDQMHVGRGVEVEFPVDDATYRIDHDELVRIVDETTPFLRSYSWRELGGYSTPHPSQRTLAALAPYLVR